MLMMGRLMLGKRSMGSRPTATKPRMVMASEAMRMAMAFRRARKVSHITLLHRFRPHLLALADQLLALHDQRLVARQALGDLHQRALGHARRHRAPAHPAVLHDEDDGLVVLDGDGFTGHEDGAGMVIDDELRPRVHAGLQEMI